ncbi:hypothetical protein ACQV2S_01165 [Facklamia sp. P13064]|uniref:hypothetical protein n=1 Tax=Facklamia sp. P13064 TaxID=3421953 RepID=UPI003D1751C9
MVNAEYYTDDYAGVEIEPTKLNRLIKRASRDINSLVGFINYEELSEWQQKLYDDAICAQVEFLATNGELASTLVESQADSFSIGSYSESKSRRVNEPKQGDITNRYALATLDYLVQAGLWYQGVRVLW